MVQLNKVANVSEWGSNPGYMGSAPDEVKTTFRFIALLRQLKLIGTQVLIASTMKNKIAKMVLNRILDP